MYKNKRKKTRGIVYLLWAIWGTIALLLVLNLLFPVTVTTVKDYEKMQGSFIPRYIKVAGIGSEYITTTRNPSSKSIFKKTMYVHMVELTDGYLLAESTAEESGTIFYGFIETNGMYKLEGELEDEGYPESSWNQPYRIVRMRGYIITSVQVLVMGLILISGISANSHRKKDKK